MNNLLIRQARDADRDAMVDVTLSAYEEYAAFIPSPHWELYRQDIVDTLCEASAAETLVAEQGGKLVGSVLLFSPGPTTGSGGDALTPPQPEVRLLAVSPAARGQGIGRALMEAVIRRAGEMATAVTLHTNDVFMRPAVHLYEHLGFRRAPELDFTPAEGIVIKGYRLDLDGAGEVSP